MALTSVNTEALSLLGLQLQYHIADFSELTMTQICTTETRRLSEVLSSRNSNTSIFGTQTIQSMYDEAFGSGTVVVQLAKLMAALDHGRRSWDFVLYAIPPILVIVTGLRFLSRALVMRRIMAADWVALAATISTLALNIIFIVGFRRDGGKHSWDVSYESLKFNYLIAHLGEVWYLPNVILVKVSLLLFYRELSRERWYRLSLYIIAATTLVVSIMGTIVGTWSCNPTIAWKHLWDYGVVSRCRGQLWLLRFCVAYSPLSDAFILALPIIAVSRMEMTCRERIGAICLFFVAGFGILCAIVLQITLPHYNRSYDRTWHEIPVVTLSLLEPCVGILCGSLPSIRVLLLYWSRRLRQGDSVYRLNSRGLGIVGKGESCVMPRESRDAGVPDEVDIPDENKDLSDDLERGLAKNTGHTQDESSVTPAITVEPGRSVADGRRESSAL